MRMTSSQPTAESELGAEVTRYRRRPEPEILRNAGVSAGLYYGGPIFAALSSLLLSLPVILLAKHMGAVPPFLKDPAWGPILVGWYLACLLTLLWLMYVRPRRTYLAIHRNGFVFQNMCHRYSIRFQDIAECHVLSTDA